MDADRLDATVLVAAAVHGDEGAWRAIVDRYTSLIVSVVLPYRLSSTDLQDVAQTVWLRLIEHLGELREPRALPTWLITTAKREALRSATESTRVHPTDPHDDAWALRLVSEDDQDAGFVRSERHRMLTEGLPALSARQRLLLVILSEDPPVPYAEISRRTGIPVGAIGPTRARALERLRRAPSRHVSRGSYGTPPRAECQERTGQLTRLG